MLVLFLGGVESTAGLIGTLFKLLAENPDQRDDPAGEPRADPRRRRGGHPHRHAAAAGRAHHLAGGHAARRDDPGGRARGAACTAPPTATSGASPTRTASTSPAASSATWASARACTAASARRWPGWRPRSRWRRRCRSSATTRITDVPERYKTTPNMYVWEHLHLAFPVTEARAPRPPRPRRDGRPPHRHDRRHPRAGDRGPGRGQGRSVAEGVVALTLKTLDGAPLPEWTPGAHVDLILGGGAPNRQYSLCGDVDDPGAYRLGILRDAGRRRRLAARPRPAGRGRRRAGPRAAQQLRARALAALPLHRGRHRHHADPADDRRGRGGGRRVAAASTAAARGRRWRSSTSWRRTATASTVCPQDETGLLDLATLLGTPEPDTLVYCCGPEPLLAAVEAALRGVAVGRAAPGAVRRPADGRAGARRGVRRRAGAQRPDPHRAAGALDPRRRRGGRGRRAVLVRRGHLRHVRDRACSTGGPTTATPCSRRPSRAANSCMLICVSRSCTDRLVLDL